MNKRGLLQALAEHGAPGAGAVLASLRLGNAPAQVAAQVAASSAVMAAAAASSWQEALSLAAEVSGMPRQQWVMPPNCPAIATTASATPLSLAAVAQVKQRRRQQQRHQQQQCECCSGSESDACSGEESPSSVLCMLDDCCAAKGPASTAVSAAAQSSPDCKPKLQPSWLDEPQQQQKLCYSKQAGPQADSRDARAALQFSSWRPSKLLQASANLQPPACIWLPAQQKRRALQASLWLASAC
jgi:hypothetical protein